MYTNYDDGNAKYGAGSTLGSSVFMEANYFRNCKYPMLTSMQGSDVYAGGTKRDPSNNGTFSKEAGGTIKAYGNYMEGSYTFIPYGATSYKVKGAETTAASQEINTSVDFDAFVVDSRDAKVPSTVKSYDGENAYNNFDTDKSVMYSYKADDAAMAKANVMAYAGRVQGGDFKWTFDNSKDDASSDVNQALKDALVAYKGWNGNAIPEYSSSSSAKSSSSSVPASSSSAKSSSSEKSSSSSAESSSSEGAESSSSVESSSSTDALVASVPLHGESMRYVAGESRLEIYAPAAFRVSVARVDGRNVLSSTARVVDLSRLPSGVYLVRLVNENGMKTLCINKQ